MVHKGIGILLVVQASYTIITGVWPLVDIRSFMLVTGYKTDIWLVKTVGAILIPVAICFFAASRQREENWPVFLLAIGSCIALTCIDFYYTMNNTIKWVYQVDGYLQLIFLASWLVLLYRWRKV